MPFACRRAGRAERGLDSQRRRPANPRGTATALPDPQHVGRGERSTAVGRVDDAGDDPRAPTSPSTSSITAAPGMMRPSAPRRPPGSPSTRAVTLVAVSVAADEHVHERLGARVQPGGHAVTERRGRDDAEQATSMPTDPRRSMRCASDLEPDRGRAGTARRSARRDRGEERRDQRGRGSSEPGNRRLPSRSPASSSMSTASWRSAQRRTAQARRHEDGDRALEHCGERVDQRQRRRRRTPLASAVP